MDDMGHLVSRAREGCVSLGAAGSENNEVYLKTVGGGASSCVLSCVGRTYILKEVKQKT